MQKFQMTLAFRGTAYHGFQVQENALSVCEVFQDAVEAAFGVRYPVKGCSRTDAGVHAVGYVLTLDCGHSITSDALQRALNVRLPGDMAVLSCKEAAGDFHPRYNALGKRYLYKIWNSPVKNPFLEDLALQVGFPIDAELANRAAGVFTGTHDFSALCAAGGKVEDKVRTIYHCGVTREGDLVVLSVTGDGFLYHMVRILMGTVLEVCAGKRPLGELPEVLASGDRARAGATAPPHGLYLDRVFYTPGELEEACKGQLTIDNEQLSMKVSPAATI